MIVWRPCKSKQQPDKNSGAICDIAPTRDQCPVAGVRVHVHKSVMRGRMYEFVQLDVFTQTPLAGNPLAIFTDARGLNDGEMQALAREMNLSETTFILPRDAATEAGEGKKVRIFTVEAELPFAGHPTLGTALYLYASESKKPAESLST